MSVNVLLCYKVEQDRKSAKINRQNFQCLESTIIKSNRSIVTFIANFQPIFSITPACSHVRLRLFATPNSALEKRKSFWGHHFVTVSCSC